MKPLRVLLLGGTGEALRLAARLDGDARFAVTTSLAGRVSQPMLPAGDVRIGGFGGTGGLLAYLRAARIEAVVDATHPFAAQMSRHAFVACAAGAIPLVVLARPPWTASDGDQWLRVPDVAAAASRAREIGRRIFLTIGRQGLDAFSAINDRWFLIRSIDEPDVALPGPHELLLARGPFTVDAEIATMHSRGIDIVVTKDSGGDATEAKLVAARTLGIPVVVIDRPAPSGAHAVVNSEAIVQWLAVVAGSCTLEVTRERRGTLR